MMNRLTLLAAAMVLASGFPAAAPAQSTAPDTASNRVVATVNGEEIHISDVEMMYRGLPEQYQQLPMQILYTQLLERLVERKLTARAAREAGLADDVEVKRRLAYLGEQVLQERFLLLKIEAALTEARLRAAYDKMVAELPAGEEIRASHILMKSEADAVAIIAELVAGADFAETAKAKSTGPSAANGGDLGFFGRDQMIKEFADAAFALQTGEFTRTPVKTQFGWHVIKLEERREAAPPSYEESVDKLRSAEARAVVQELAVTLRENADVKLFNPDGSEIEPAPVEGGKTTP